MSASPVSGFYREREALREAVRELAAWPGALALDVGCKHGDVARALAGKVGRLVALDLERHPDWQQPEPNLRFLAGSAMALPFADATFDVVVSSECLQYVADPGQALAELARVVRPGGVLVLSFPEGRFLSTWLDPYNLAHGLGRLLPRRLRPATSFVRHLRAGSLLAALPAGSGERATGSEPPAAPSLACEQHLRRGSILFIHIACLIDQVQGARTRAARLGPRASRLADAALGPVVELLCRAMVRDFARTPRRLWYNNVVVLRRQGAGPGVSPPRAPSPAPAAGAVPPGPAQAGLEPERLHGDPAGAAPPPRSPSRRRRRAFAAAALALSLAASGLLAEIVLRAVFGAPLPNRRPLMARMANPARGWQMVPFQDHYTYDQHVTLDQLGLRCLPFAEARGDEVPLLALGDSLVYGQGVADGETIPAHLERRLEQDGPRCRVFNGGHRGYATAEEVALLEELAGRIRPEVVVLYWYWNDLEETDPSACNAWLERTGPLPFDTGYRLEGAGLLRWRALQLLRRSAAVVYAHQLVQAALSRPPGPAAIEAGLGRLDGHLARLAERARGDGFHLLVAVVPDRAAARPRPVHDGGREPSGGGQDASGGGQDEDHWSVAVGRQVEAIANRHGIPTLDLREAVAAVARRLGRDPVVPYDGHYLGEANQAMADRTAARLRELGWWPEPEGTAGRPRSAGGEAIALVPAADGGHGR